MDLLALVEAAPHIALQLSPNSTSLQQQASRVRRRFTISEKLFKRMTWSEFVKAALDPDQSRRSRRQMLMVW